MSKLPSISSLGTLLVLTVLSVNIEPSNGLQTWNNRTHEYHIAPPPVWIPVLSYVIGPLIPLPDIQPIIVHGYRDYFFSKPAEDWDAYQPMYEGGYATGVYALVLHELWDHVRDIEVWVRDFIELVVGVLRAVYCVLMTLTFTDVTSIERPQTNHDSRWRIFIEKRERLDDRIPDTFVGEWSLLRCVKRTLETVANAVYYFPKSFYYWFDKINKWYVRWGFEAIKLVFTLIQSILSTWIIAIDAEWCYRLPFVAAYTGPFCAGLLRFWFEFAMDVANAYSEELFCEMHDLNRAFWDLDNRISNTELWIFSNVTYKMAADSPDKVRADGTARIDHYYMDYASKIQSNENSEDHSSTREKDILLRAKEEWCGATWLPPVNEMYRVEYKAMWTSRLIKNDHVMDIAEFRCLTIYMAMNLKYNSDPAKNCDREIERVLERFDDIAKSIVRLDVSKLTIGQQELFLDGLDMFIRQMEGVAKMNIISNDVLEDLELIGYELVDSITAVVKDKCIGTAERRMRVVNEMDIFADLVDAKDKNNFKPAKLVC